MKVHTRVENHQPVPLRPLDEVLNENPNMVYVGKLVYEENSVATDLGWSIVVDGLLQWLSGNYTFLDMVKLDQSLGRALQPGETVIAVYEDRPTEKG